MVPRNIVVNGAMAIDQRHPRRSTYLTNGDYPVDRWMFSGIDDATFLGEQDSGSVPPPPGFAHYLGVSVGCARQPIAADWSNISQSIEADRIAPCGFGTPDAKPLALSFWVRSSIPGTHSGALSNAESSRSCPFAFAVSQPDTWEQKTLVIPADVRGNWSLGGRGKAMALVFNLAAAEPHLGSVATWADANHIGAHGTTSLVEHQGATFCITGIQLEVDTKPTPFEHEPREAELSLCRRYFEVLGGIGRSVEFGEGFCTGADTIVAQIPLLTTKRASPTVFFEGSGFTFASASGTRPVSAPVVIGAGQSAVLVAGKIHDGQVGEHGRLSNQNDPNSRIILSAEL